MRPRLVPTENNPSRPEQWRRSRVGLLFPLLLVSCIASCGHNAVSPDAGGGSPPAADTSASSSEPGGGAQGARGTEPAAAPRTEPQSAATDDIEDEGVLIDFRSELAYDAPSLSAEKRRHILRAVDGARSAPGDAYINSIEEGAFTAANSAETAYLIQKGGPRAADPSSLKGTTLAIFGGGSLLARFDVSDYNFILRTSDLNDDGVNELLLSGGNTHMGELSQWAQLVEVRDKQLRVIRDFKLLHRDSCDNGFAASREIIAGVVRAAGRPAGDFPTFNVEYYRAPCSSKKDGKRYPDEFKPAPDASLNGPTKNGAASGRPFGSASRVASARAGSVRRGDGDVCFRGALLRC